VEYVYVSGPEGHRVFVDGQLAGATNTILQVQAGPHEFSLGQPQDDAAERKLVMILNTSSLSPAKVKFEQ
jgi:hypothetical protein